MLDRDQVSLLKHEADLLLSGSSKHWDSYNEFSRNNRWDATLLAEPGRVSTYFDVIGQSKVIDTILNELLGRKNVGNLLESILGSDFHIWYATLRRVEVGSKPLRMHQDRSGEVGLNILIDDVNALTGTTVFIKGSHRWPAVLKSLIRFYPSRIRRFLSGVIGDAGDAYLFYNSTLHGQVETDSQSRTALIVTFLPQSHFTRHPSAEILASLAPHLRRALSPACPNGLRSDLPTFPLGPDKYVVPGYSNQRPDFRKVISRFLNFLQSIRK